MRFVSFLGKSVWGRAGSAPLLEVGHPLPSFFIGAAWMKFFPCVPQKLTIKHISIVFLLFSNIFVLLTKSLLLYLIPLLLPDLFVTIISFLPLVTLSLILFAL